MNILNFSIKKKALEAAENQESLNRMARMSAKLAQIKSDMGEKWILHPSNKVTKLDKPRGF